MFYVALLSVNPLHLLKNKLYGKYPNVNWPKAVKPLPKEQHFLRLKAGRSSGTLSGIEITCSYGAHKRMAEAFNEQSLTKIGVTCSGGRPWLGQEAERNNTQHNCS
ncbi:MAG: hypothetical protein ACR2FN_03210 [Chitinophagaceae bacterium]